ncbi:urease accessory protein UreE [Mangrovicella endophytica]|uniref:urease accessory protein UreE n=1 Tax=Mangrovicella endophytica TaxID=2066697 RepID=UPI000C9E21F8|nr:urease accessory protein UreE [Mangrovicella endophytica]
MIRATEVVSGPQQATADDTITLDETARHRRRMAMVSDNGIAFMLDLPEAVLLRQGDRLALEDGRFVEVLAKPEPLLAVAGHDARHLLVLSWHIGNRHLAAEIAADRILIRRDPVIAEMLAGLGASLEEVEAPFHPEGGAYAGSHGGHEAHGSAGHHHGHDDATQSDALVDDHGHSHTHGHGHR